MCGCLLFGACSYLFVVPCLLLVVMICLYFVFFVFLVVCGLRLCVVGCVTLWRCLLLFGRLFLRMFVCGRRGCSPVVVVGCELLIVGGVRCLLLVVYCFVFSLCVFLLCVVDVELLFIVC